MRLSRKKTISIFINGLGTVIVILSVFLTLSFLYNNFYKSFIYSNEVYLLNKKVRRDSVDIKRFEKIVQEIERKNKPRKSDVFIKFH